MDQLKQATERNKMLSYKEFLKENQQEPAIPIVGDHKFTLDNLDKANEDLDLVTNTTFVNSSIFVNAVRGTLERFGVVLPAASNMQQLAIEAEYVYALGDSGHYVYMVHDLDPDGHVEGYAQIVDQEELADLKELDDDEDNQLPSEPNQIRKYPPARRDDDSGNDSEYT